VDFINVYLEQSRTPLPLLTTETAWLGGRHIRIRGTLADHGLDPELWAAFKNMHGGKAA
jgi:hypothetical protein